MAIQRTLVGRFVTFGTTRDHSERPSISIASCAPVTRIVPSRTGGQAKPPSSSHLVARTRPEPPRHLGYVHLRIGALGQDPHLLLIAPIAPSPTSRDNLD